MGNTLSFPVVYSRLLDTVFKNNSVTNDMVAGDNSYRFSAEDAKTVYLQEMALQGLGDYTKYTGYDSGDITVSWRAYTMGQDRSKKFVLDTMDAREAYTTILQVANEFTRLHVVPEVDAYRFHKICSDCSVDTTGTLTYDTVIEAIRTAIKSLDDNEVPAEGRRLYVSTETMANIEKSGEFYNVKSANAATGINTQVTSFNGVEIIVVPKSRFYTIFDFAASGAGGFTPNASGKEINFMLIWKPAIIAVVKHVAPKLITPELNQSSDGWIYAYRMYHELFTAYNKRNGVYIHSKA